ncbi:hypothetical protein N0V82_008192 [Gnomoniopsis sp. IMI 355080]|nr:hypothetical protein N0V82_008192 [Gnomoniopsis sp. IMI 355080]
MMVCSVAGSGGPASPSDLDFSVSSNTSVVTFPESSFFMEQRAPALPSPAQIRASNQKTGHPRATDFDRPVPVSIPSLGLFVKYGGDVTSTEADTQIFVREQLRQSDHPVPIPEVFGYAEDGGQRFIYMALMEGKTLQERFAKLTEMELQAICAELKGMVDAWRRVLKQDPADLYIAKTTGSVGKRPLNDYLFDTDPHEAGPFLGPAAAQDFHKACDIHIFGPEPVVFTHDDLCPPNILISEGPEPKVTAIIDFGQSGWYPWYWEWCKARRVGRIDEGVFEYAHAEEWRTKYLPLVLESADDEKFYHPWLFRMLSRG